MAELKAILLVEDEALIAADEGMMLQNEGYIVKYASSGEEAISRVRAEPWAFSLILMDINLGDGMDGTQAAQEILREIDLPIIFLSSHTEREVVEKTEGIPSYGFVVKSTGITVLSASIKMAFKQYAAHQALQSANETLHVRTERFVSLAANIPGLISFVNADTLQYEYVNDQFGKSFGRPTQEIVGHHVREIIGESNFQFALKYIEVVRAGKSISYENVFQFTSGKRWVKVNYAPLFGTNGQVVSIIVLSYDITEHRQAEETLRQSETNLRESEKRYRTLVETADDTIIMTDLLGKHIFHNSAYYSSLGYTGSEEVDLEGVDRVHPDDIALVRAGMQELLNTGRSSGEYRVKHHDGHWVYRYNKASIIRDSEGKPQAILSIIRDITRRKEMEEKLLQSENFFRALVENSYDAITLVNRAGMTFFQSPSVMRLTGYSLEESLQHTALANVYQEDVPVLQAAYTRLLACPGSMERMEFRSVRKDKSLWWTEATATNLLDVPGVRAIVVNYHDITDRKRVHEALLESQANLMGVFNATDEAILLLAADQTLLALNEVAMQGINNSHENPVGHYVFELFPAETYAYRRQFIQQVLSTCQPVMFEDQVDDCWLSHRLHPIVDSQGQAARLVIYSRDITEYKQVQDALHASNERLQTLLEEKDVLLREVHHRIKNNMNTITNLLTLQADTQADIKTQMALQDASARVHSMMVLYDKLYRSADINEISIQEYIPTLLNEIVALFPRKNTVKISTLIDDIVLPQKILSPLGIILNELTTNAMKYAFPGRYGGKITVIATHEDRHITILFADNGIGLPQTYSIEKSPGFGMQLVGILVEQIHGSIKIERDGGTRFIIEFNH